MRLMAAELRKLQGKAINQPERLSGHSALLRSLAIDYTVSGGANRAERQELIIYSWNREAEPAGLF